MTRERERRDRRGRRDKIGDDATDQKSSYKMRIRKRKSRLRTFTFVSHGHRPERALSSFLFLAHSRFYKNS